MDCVKPLNSKGLTIISTIQTPPISPSIFFISMAKIKDLEYPKPKTSLYLCCFGSVHRKTPTEHCTITRSEQKCGSSSWFPWQRIRLGVKNLMAKTVPLDGSEFDDIQKLKLKFKDKANKVHSSGWKWKSKSKSDLLTRSNSIPSKSQENLGNNLENDTRQQSKSSPTKAVSVPSSKLRVRRSFSSTHSHTTSNNAKHKQVRNTEMYNIGVVARWMIVIILVSMIVWGRLCSILCTTACFYLIPCFTVTLVNHKHKLVSYSSNGFVLDSNMDKKRRLIPRCNTSL